MKKLVRQNIDAMAGYVPGEQPTDPNVVKLNTNENPYPPSPNVARALETLSTDCLRRYPNPRGDSLRQCIAAYHGCEVSQVFVGNGSDEVLALCTRAFVENDGSVGYFDPSYSLYPVLAEIAGVEKRPVALTDDFGWSMPDDYTCSLFFLANPNAPTSICFDRDDIEAFCDRFEGTVVIDEAYVDFADADCVDIALSRPNVLVSRTLSKSYSLAGLRLGYAIGDASLIEAFDKIKDSYNLDALTQQLGLAALSDPGHMRQNAQKIRATRHRLGVALVEFGFDVLPSQTNFVWAKPSTIEARVLFERLRGDGILVRYFPGERTGSYVRITVGTDEEIDKLLAWLRKELK